MTALALAILALIVAIVIWRAAQQRTVPLSMNFITDFSPINQLRQ
jgi:hypothetical protein